jgi:hypothetical protein
LQITPAFGARTAGVTQEDAMLTSGCESLADRYADRR